VESLAAAPYCDLAGGDAAGFKPDLPKEQGASVQMRRFALILAVCPGVLVTIRRNGMHWFSTGNAVIRYFARNGGITVA
jgi:hypothetical protein